MQHINNGEYDAVTSATTKKSKGFEATYYTEQCTE